MAATMLPFPTLIPVDNNDLKSVALSVDVVLVPCRSRIRDPDRRRHFLIHTSQWTFPTCLRGPKEELPIKPRPLQEVHQRKTLVMGPAFPNENRNPNKWETQRNSLRSSFVFQFVKTMLFILTILGG